MTTNLGHLPDNELLNVLKEFTIKALDRENELEAQRDRLAEAMKVAVAHLNTPDPSFGMVLKAASVLRAALASRQEG